MNDDFISRQAVLNTIHLFFTEEIDKIPTKKTEDGEVLVIHKCQPLFEMNKALCKRIKELPSFPTERTGRWITYDVHGHKACKCSECNKDVGYPCNDNFCPKCGADMRADKGEQE